MQIQLLYSTHQAQAILGAWQAGDEQKLGEELDRVSQIPVETIDSMESERLELLTAIAGQMRETRQPFDTDSAQIHRRLLQHLGFPLKPSKSYRTTPLPPAVLRDERRVAAVPLQQKRACCGDR
jgi:hypothetical protein